ncbi:MAG: calcium-binding EGF-like domain-containing protein [Hyalangium sp.]|uniref:calcium-binding EGF-like domain-containing protein n=1 Tax=Hyalangium sp. TaxID=2028555 RepID=UPI00389988CF
MTRPLSSALLLVAALHATACVVNTTDTSSCDPNPCTEANRGVCIEEAGEARCLCDTGFIARPSGACEAVGPSNCAEHAGDLSEPDDCQARAHPLSSGGPQVQQTIEPIGDYDFFQFNATARNVYSLTVKADGALMPRLDVFDQGGAWLTSAEAPGHVTLYFKARVTSSHFARVSHSPVDPSVATGSYTLAFNSLGTEDHGDSPDDTTHISPDSITTSTPSSFSGRFEYPGDEDWFSFSGSAGHTYRLNFDPNQTVPPVAVFASSNLHQPLVTAQSPSVSFFAPANDTFFIVLDPPQSLSGPGGYAFNLLVN